MDVVIFYFSQTGNTRAIAEAISMGFSAVGREVHSVPMHEAIVEEASECEMIGFGSPCFSSRAPTPAIDFISALPPLNKTLAFVFATCGGAPGRVLHELANGMRWKGATVVGGFLSRGEVHHPAPHVKGFAKGRPSPADFARAKTFATLLVQRYLMDPSSGINSIGRESLQSRGTIYDLLGRSSTDETMRLMMPQPILDPDLCTQCDWCAAECPMGNIRLDPYPLIGERCIRCYRCLTGCVEGAFRADWRFVDPFLWLLYNPRFVRWFGGLSDVEM